MKQVFQTLKTTNSPNSLKFDTINESFNCPENKIHFDKGDSDAQVYLNKTLSLEIQVFINDKIIKNENKIKELFSFSSLEKYLIPYCASLSEDSQFFLTKNRDLESSFQDETESYS